MFLFLVLCRSFIDGPPITINKNVCLIGLLLKKVSYLRRRFNFPLCHPSASPIYKILKLSLILRNTNINNTQTMLIQHKLLKYLLHASDKQCKDLILTYSLEQSPS
jgi:hypothetical protein